MVLGDCNDESVWVVRSGELLRLGAGVGEVEGVLGAFLMGRFLRAAIFTGFKDIVVGFLGVKSH
jgi:hypothetical protein